jgi:hypothetical protein
MKTLINSFRIGLIFLAVFSLFSCEKKNSDTGIGTAEFSISSSDEKSLSKSDASGDSALVSYQIMISVEDMEGNPVFTDKLIPLYTFGTGFVSENVEIKAGEYKLTKFLVIDPSGDVVYAAPLAGFPLAYLVNKPLPLGFTIFPDQVTRILPEVLPVGDNPPEQFGYANFGVQIIKPLEFWTICYLDNPIIMPPIVPTTAILTIYSANGWHYTFKLEARLNHLIIRGGSEIYYFILEKEGYLPQKMQFYARELKATTPENPLVLTIPWDAQYKKMVLQPGPVKGKDAMISNLDADKNFGDHKYFEATFLSEPVLTVMRSNRSLIWFNLDTLPKSAVIKKVILQLSYDLPIPFDSTYIINTDPSGGVVSYGGVLQQIVEPWEEYKVTWNTQPKTIEANQVYIPPFIINANFIRVDVTRLFVPLAEIAAPNYGMFFRLWPTERFPGFRFASSDYPESKMRPMLIIYYTLP